MTKRKIPECNAPATDNSIVLRGYTDTDNHQWAEAEFKGKKALVEYFKFGEPRGIWAALGAKGVVIVRKADKASLIEQVENLEEFPPRLIFSHPGWCGGQIAMASGRVIRPNGTTKGAIAFAPNPTKCAKAGTAQRWTKTIAMPLTGHHIPCFFIMAAFAAAMLDITKPPENFGFEIAGEGGKGKSTCQRLMASTAGPAMDKARGYMGTFLMTPVALEKSMQWHSDMPFIIDEANLFGSGEGGRADKRKMREFGFAMGSGTTKGRADDPQQQSYRFVFFTSANESFNELLTETHRLVAGAATDRLMTITVPEGDAGVFGELPEGFEGYRSFTIALETAMRTQHGTAMPKFLKALVEARHRNEEGLLENIRKRMAKFHAHIGYDPDVRIAEAFGLVYAAGLFAQHHGVLPKEWDCLGAATHCYTNFRNAVPIRQKLGERLLAIANRPETVTIDAKNLPSLTDKQVADAGAFVRVIKGETLLLMTTAFGQKMFPDWNALKGTADFVSLNRANDRGRGRGYHCRIRSNKRADWFYCFKLPEDFILRQ